MRGPLSWKPGRDAGLELGSLHIEAAFPEGHSVGLYSSGGRVIKRSTRSRSTTLFWLQTGVQPREGPCLSSLRLYSYPQDFIMLKSSDFHAIASSWSQLMLSIYMCWEPKHIFLLMVLVIPLRSWLASHAGSFIKVLSELPAWRDLLLSIFIFVFKVSEYPKLASRWFSFSFLTSYSSIEKKINHINFGYLFLCMD